MHTAVVGFAWTAGPRVPILLRTLGVSMCSRSHKRYQNSFGIPMMHPKGWVRQATKTQTLSGARGAKKKCREHFGGQINKNSRIH